MCLFLVSPRRYNFRLPYRLNQSNSYSPRLSTRSKSVRISTDNDIIPIRKSPSLSKTKSHSRPIVSILRRNNSNSTLQSRRLVDPSHIWKSDDDGKIYILDQFSIPRYYRLYNDVSFREVYHFSRLLEPYLQRKRSNSRAYSSIVRNFALNGQLPTITSVA